MAESERQQGAQAERDAVKAWAKRLRSNVAQHEMEPVFRQGEICALDLLLTYLDGRAKRYNAKPGGLGKGSRQAKG